VFRGGSWTSTAGTAAISSRYSYNVSNRYNNLGFRLALNSISETLSPPTNVSATLDGTTAIYISWSSVATATSYELYRSNDNAIYQLLQSGITATSYTDNSPLTGSNYYKVKAINTIATSSLSTASPEVVFSNASSDATLNSLTVSQGTLSPTFAATTYAYTVNVANSISSITITGTANHSAATVSGNGAKTLAVGNNPVDITVTAEDGSTKIYTVTINRAASNDATLNNLTVSTGTLNPVFDANTTSYTVSVANNVTSITVTGTANHSTATVSGNGAKTLSVGANTVYITVTAEDGSTKIYTITITRLSNDATLSNLTVSEGTLNPVFDANTTSYTVSVANSVASITITGTANHANATVSGNGAKTLVVGANPVAIMVTAEDGSTKTYTVTINRAASDDATLSNLTVSTGTLNPVFNANTTSYAVSVANSVASITVTGTANHANATVSGNGAKTLAVGNNPVDITVTAEDGSTKIYTITITRLSNDATLNNLTVSAGTLNPVFAANTTSYTVSVANSVTSITVSGTANHTNATVSGNGAKTLVVGDNPVDITVTAEDGSTKTYTVTINRAASDDATLSNLTVSAGTLNPVFAASTTSYTVSVANDVTSLTVTGTANHSQATVSGNGAKTLVVGDNVVSIVVTAEDGTTNTYTVTVVRAASDDATLSSLTISSGTLSPAFEANATNYAVNVTTSVTSIDVTGTATHANATVSGNGTKTLIVGVNVVSLVVTAEDGTTTKTYTVTIAVTQAVTGINLNTTATILSVNGTEQLSATITPANADNQNVIWSSSNPAVATVNNSGLVTGVSVGSATITATTEDGGKTATCAVTVQEGTISVTGISLDKSASVLSVNGAEQLTATVAPANATNKSVSWSSSNTAVATVSNTGLVTGVSVGSATVTVTTVDGNHVAICEITVQTETIAMTGISLNKTTTTVTVNGTNNCRLPSLLPTLPTKR